MDRQKNGQIEKWCWQSHGRECISRAQKIHSLIPFLLYLDLSTYKRTTNAKIHLYFSYFCESNFVTVLSIPNYKMFWLFLIWSAARSRSSWVMIWHHALTIWTITVHESRVGKGSTISKQLLCLMISLIHKFHRMILLRLT